jgi:Rps23 Pro-64 3,4-dihydroxylase Tpa1-like proline 4-hydroxylase
MLTRNDREALADEYRTKGIVRIASFLPDDRAAELHAHLRARTDWRHVFNSGDKLFELDRDARSAMDAAKRSELDQAIYAGARQGFQYRYETIRIPDERAAREAIDDPIANMALDMSSGETRDFLRFITGTDAIQFADAQATAYSPGDFLTGHDDAFPGKNRFAAYVLGLTPVWRLEWGGLLIMHGGEAEPSRAYPPAMNVLTLFGVGQMHSVSEVTRAAAYRRYAITGWLRS